MRRAVVVALAALLLGGFAAIVAMPGSQEWFSAAVGGRGTSMSHGPEPQAGVLDDGDLGNYQRFPPPEAVTPMMAARAAGLPPVAGEPGDVLLFRADGEARHELGRRVLVEHRALAWVAYDEATGLFDVPELGLDDVRAVTLRDVPYWDAEQGAYLRRDYTLVLVADGPAGATYPAGRHSGWVTKGDHNALLDQQPRGEAAPLSALVRPAWVEGRLVRVVDQDAMQRDVLVGVVLALLLGVGAVLVRHLLRGTPILAPRRSDPAFDLEPVKRPLPGAGAARAVGQLLRPACECGAAWGDMPFCAKCGAERHRRDRYASPEARAAAARASRRR